MAARPVFQSPLPIMSRSSLLSDNILMIARERREKNRFCGVVPRGSQTPQNTINFYSTVLAANDEVSIKPRCKLTIMVTASVTTISEMTLDDMMIFCTKSPRRRATAEAVISSLLLSIYYEYVAM